MIIITVLLVLAVPHFIGLSLIRILGERDRRGPVSWVLGVLFLFVCFLGCLLIALRKDYSLEALARLFGIVTASLTVGSLPVFILSLKKEGVRAPSFEKEYLIWIVPSIIIGIVSVFITGINYISDIAMETVRTTLYENSLYQVSALLGTKMEAGLPIFNKIEIMPMLYAVISSDLKVDPFFTMEILSPLLVYTANIIIMWEISKKAIVSSDRIKDVKKARTVFMLTHLCMLLAGLYLPGFATPVTSGWPILRQGYSGYAWAYGVAVPMMILMMLDKRFILAGVSISSVLGLVRWDRIFYVLKDFFTNYKEMNSVGKLWIIYVLAVLWWLKRSWKNKEKHPEILLSGSALISLSVTDVYEFLGEKRSLAVFSWLVILTAGFAFPYTHLKEAKDDNGLAYSYIAATVGVPETTSSEDIVIWAPEEAMRALRRHSAELAPVYSRDLYDEYLVGVNYEEEDEEAKKLYEIMSVIEKLTEYSDTEAIKEKILTNGKLRDVDVILLPSENLREDIYMTLVRLGFTRTEEVNEYVMLRRP